ncbi:hypothetical protein ASPZODRAFT_31702, partial [Penicilliopsis zonata CBS 506.65]
RQSVLLSIVDATHISSGTAETVLFYDGPDSSSSSSRSPPPTPDQLQAALARTLDAYPQWCGRLYRQPGRPGRLMLTFGGAGIDDIHGSDPGVVFLVARADCPLVDLVPPVHQRAPAWDVSAFPLALLMPQLTLSVSNLNDPALPSVAVQVTSFTCGGMAVALKISHPLADATSLAGFVLDWAANTQQQQQQQQRQSYNSNIEAPIFDPELLDRCAAGDPNHPDPEPQLVARALALPCLRYDTWISHEGCPFPARWTEIPEEFRSLPADPPGQRVPWEEWDLKAPVARYVIHFSQGDLQRLWQEATSSTAAGKEVSDTTLKFSYHDALVAHVWSCVNRARRQIEVSETNVTDDNATVYLNYTLGIRKRTHPPLPDRFVGSPTVAAAISATSQQVCSEETDTLAHLATRIRKTVALFTSDNLAAHLHMKLHEQCPQRMWPSFPGRRHLVVTSWVRTRLYEADFGSGTPRYVKGVMPSVDGMLHVMEGAPKVTAACLSSSTASHWTDHGVDVQLHLAKGAMKNLLQDPTFW